MEEESSIVHIDCTQCGTLGALNVSEKCRACLPKEPFERVRLKTKYLIKEYDSNLRLLSITPFFIDVRLSYDVDPKNRLLKSYVLKSGAFVQIFEIEHGVGNLYYVRIPEMLTNYYNLRELHNEIEEFEKTGITKNEIVNRWYKDMGILEHLITDENILEVNINPPGYKIPIRIVHQEFDECITNIYPSDDFLNYFETRLRLESGRPLNKSQPQLDSEMMIANKKVRIASVIEPFSVFGTGFSLRKHREKPWTIPLFIENKALNFWAAGLMSFIITHGRSFIVAGPRGSGKTSLLGSFLLEILPKYRIITIEDTQEIPVNAYKNLGYDILPLKVRSALLKTGMEMPFDIGLRTSLRLGDSCLIIGEIRSIEAQVLYEAMRIGAMSNVVAGTIHADTPYGVYDRVVNDLGVTKGSFKVTDLIIVVNQIKDPTGLKRVRRVTNITEVLKDWEDTPKFQDLLVYNPKTDQLEPTEAFLNGKSVVLNIIMGVTKGFSDYNSLLRDIALRGWAKSRLLSFSKKKDFLEAPYVVETNILYDKLFSKFNPLESEKNENMFKAEFDKRLKDILS